MIDAIYEIENCAVVDIENGYVKDEDGLREYIDEACDNACIYYSDCFNIIQQSHVTDFEPYFNEFGATTVTAIAYYVLREAVDESGLYRKLEEVLEENTCEECECHKCECECDFEEPVEE